MQRINRIDLSRSTLLVMLAGVLIASSLIAIFMADTRPGSATGQRLALVGCGLLLVPFAFSIFKRGSAPISPPRWFVIHVVCAALGILLIFAHAAGGQWASPPGLVLACLFLLVVQGFLARAIVSPRIGELFAAHPNSFGFGGQLNIDKTQLAHLINQKQTVLESLDPIASEALFSPNLSHWIAHPILTLRYIRLSGKEASLVGSRGRAGLLLRWWRPIHILLSVLFLFGMIAHIVVVLFFAGYVAGDQPIDWWHIRDWGRP